MATEKDLLRRVERQAKRIRKAERERATVIGQTVYLGTLGLVFVLPIVGGAYLGRWLDSLAEGYSVRWTTSCIILGVVVGMFNVYFLLKE